MKKILLAALIIMMLFSIQNAVSVPYKPIESACLTDPLFYDCVLETGLTAGNASINISGGGGNTTEEMQDACGAMFNFSLVYDDAADDAGVNQTWINDTILALRLDTNITNCSIAGSCENICYLDYYNHGVLIVNETIQSGGPGKDGNISIYSEQGATDYVITIKPDSAMTMSTHYTLPKNDGSPNEFLQTNGAGVLDWVPQSIQSYEVFKTFACPLGDDVSATSGSDTMTYTSSDNTVDLIGNSLAKSIDFKVNESTEYNWTKRHNFTNYILVSADNNQPVVNFTQGGKTIYIDELYDMFYGIFSSAEIYFSLSDLSKYVYFPTNGEAIINTDGGVHMDDRVRISDNIIVEGNETVNGTRKGFFQATVGTSQTHASTAELAHNFTSEQRKDVDYYTHSTSSKAEEVTVLKTGWYRISYSISFDSDTNDRIAYRGYVEDDGAEISPSDSYTYSRSITYARHATVQNTFITHITANSVIEVHTQIYQGAGNFGETADTDTIVDESWILIEKI